MKRFFTTERMTQSASWMERSVSSRTNGLEPRTHMEIVRPGLGTPVIFTTFVEAPTVFSSATSAWPSISGVNWSMCATGLQSTVWLMNSMSLRSMLVTTMILSLDRKCSDKSFTASRRTDFWMSSTLQPVFWMALHILRICLRSSRKMRSILAYSETTTEFSRSVFGAVRQNWMRPILALVMRTGPRAVWDARLLKTRPFTSSVSSMVPPWAFTTLILFKSTFSASGESMTASTASTASGASFSEYCDTTLDDKDVVAASTSTDLSSRLTGMAMPVRISSALLTHSWNASVIAVGWMPFSSRFEHWFNSEPASTVTDVVPSPASISCERASSTSILAVGWNTCMWDRMVAPSLVIMTSPLPSSIILSIPRGPSDVRTASATAEHKEPHHTTHIRVRRFNHTPRRNGNSAIQPMRTATLTLRSWGSSQGGRGKTGANNTNERATATTTSRCELAIIPADVVGCHRATTAGAACPPPSPGATSAAAHPLG